VINLRQAPGIDPRGAIFQAQHLNFVSVPTRDGYAYRGARLDGAWWAEKEGRIAGRSRDNHLRAQFAFCQVSGWGGIARPAQKNEILGNQGPGPGAVETAPPAGDPRSIPVRAGRPRFRGAFLLRKRFVTAAPRRGGRIRGRISGRPPPSGRLPGHPQLKKRVLGRASFGLPVPAWA